MHKYAIEYITKQGKRLGHVYANNLQEAKDKVKICYGPWAKVEGIIHNEIPEWAVSLGLTKVWVKLQDMKKD